MHRRSECKHGVLIEQCRCPGPSKVTILPCPEWCEKGVAEIAEEVAPRRKDILE